MPLAKKILEKRAEFVSRARLESERAPKPYAVYRCDNCRREKTIDNEWLVPYKLMCLICGNNITVKVRRGQDFNIKDWQK